MGGEIQALNSPEGAEQDDVIDNLDATAVSSDATDVASEAQDTTSIVRDVVAEARGEAASSATGQEQGSQGEQQEAPREPDNENFSDVPFKSHPRFQQLLRQRAAFKVDAERYQNVQAFLDNNGLGAQEAADALIIAGLMKTNPAAAWERLRPVVQNLLTVAGEVLPNDLAQRVQNGEMSHEAALEVSRARAQVQSQQAHRQFEVQRGQRMQEQQRAQSLYDTAARWEAERRQRDPNFEAKLAPLQKELAWLQAVEGKPNTPEGVQAQLKKAYDAVSVSQPVQQPQQRPRTNQPRSATGQFVGNAQPKPQTTLDIIRATRGR